MLPGTLTGLLIAVVVLIPGYVHYAIRRNLAPTQQLSTALETASLIVVAVIANASTLGLLGAMTFVPGIRGHTPDLARLLRDPSGYVLLDNARLFYIAGWTMFFLLLSSLLSAAFAYRVGPLGYLSKRLAPAIGQYSGWYQVFETEVPENASRTFVFCELTDGSYTAGDLAWFNTEPEDTPDRDLILAPPLRVQKADGRPVNVPEEMRRLVLSARDIRRLYVTYLTE